MSLTSWKRRFSVGLLFVLTFIALAITQSTPAFADSPIVDGFVQDPVIDIVEPAYVVQGITCTQDQATGDFAGILYTAEDATHLYFAFAQSVFINDNSYEINAIGWDYIGKSHILKDLIKSEHVKVTLFDGLGNISYDFFIDYAEGGSGAKGKNFVGSVESFGVTGGNGAVFVGNPDDITADTSLAWNWLNNQSIPVNAVDSPLRLPTNTYDAGTAADPADIWIYETVYEWSVPKEGFGAAGFGGITISEVHNSPFKTGNPVSIPVITVSKVADPPSGNFADPGSTILYTINLENSGTLAHR